MASPTFYSVNDGKLSLNLHYGQMKAWRSEKRYIAVLAGTQGGKTSFGPFWLWKEINARGAGDYIAVTSTYDLFKLKMLPALRETFENVFQIGRYWSGDRIIEIKDPATGKFLAERADDPMYARIILRSAESGGGLEATTAMGAWLDEAGQDSFQLEAWEAIQRRLILNRGRALMTTTLYNHGWLKEQIYDRWVDGKDKDIEVVNFDSTENPMFPIEEMERARSTMPLWRFAMQYMGKYERPAGLIYDSFNEKEDKVPRFTIPTDWPRFLGLDFGGVNTAGLFYAEERSTGIMYAYREYKAGERTAKEHADALKHGEARIPTCVGGSKSEGQWRSEFRAAGLPVQEPDCKEVEVGINRVYGAHKQGKIKIFSDLTGYIAELKSYSRKLDSSGVPTEEIENKNTYHYLDASRYILGWKFRPNKAGPAVAAGTRPTISMS